MDTVIAGPTITCVGIAGHTGKPFVAAALRLSEAIRHDARIAFAFQMPVERECLLTSAD